MQAPIEVYEAVIDEASDTPASLRLLSLTCSAFLPRSRYHLFSCILIQSVQQMESSCQLLDTCPWLPPLIRKVTLSILVPEDSANPNVRLLDVVPVHLFSRLPNLRAWSMRLRAYVYDVEKGPWLSFHRSVIWRYQQYGGRIQNLELINVVMEDRSDLMRLLSAFAGIRSLTCSWIDFRRRTGTSSVYNMLSRSLRIENLVAGPDLDICTIEYLLACSAATLDHLVITIESMKTLNDPDYFGRLETAMSQLSLLSSLVLGIPPYSHVIPWESPDTHAGMAQDMRLATRILKCVKRDRLEDVCVFFHLEPVAALGCCLSCDNRSSEACSALEDELLTYPLCGIVVRDAVVRRRAGRTEFWSRSINGAFPKLNKLGLFTFARTQTDAQDPYGHEAGVTCLVASRDSKRMVTASHDGTIIIWDAERGTPVQEWFAAEPAGPVRHIALSPDGRRLLSVGGWYGREGPVVVWDMGGDNGIVRKAATLRPDGCNGCAWSPDGGLIACVSGDGMVHVWDAQTFQPRGDPLRNSPSHAAAWPYCLQFSPNSHYLGWVSQQPPAKCCLSQPLTEEPLALFFVDADPAGRQISAPMNAFSFAPESGRIVTAHGRRDNPIEEHAVRVWDIVTGTLLVVLGVPADTWAVNNVSFSPDGLSVLSASDDGSVKIWDAKSGKRKALLMEPRDFDQSLREYRSPPRDACFSSDGRYIAIASGIRRPGRRWNQRGIVSVWRTSDASCVAEFIDHKAAWALHVAFSPNGEFLASADTEGIVHIRHISTLIEH